MEFNKPDLRSNDQSNLIDSSANGNLEAVVQLLSKGTDVNASDDNGESPLMAASFFGHAKIVDQLIASGADVDATTNDGWTALIACLSRKDIMKLLNHY